MKYTNITTATTTTINTGFVELQRIIINKAVANAVITIYDSADASGRKVGTITFPATLTSDAPYCLEYEVSCPVGLTIVTSAATDLTVITD